MQRIRLAVTLAANTPTIAALVAKLSRFHYESKFTYRGKSTAPKSVPCEFTVPHNVSAKGLRNELAEFLSGADGGALINRR